MPSFRAHLLLALLLLFLTPAHGQAQPCGTPAPTRVDTTMEQRIQAHIAARHASQARGQRGEFLTVPVVVFVIDDTSMGYAPVTPAHVREQLAVLNREFAPWGIRFCVARFDSLGQPLQPIVPAAPVVEIRQDDPAHPGVFWVSAYTAGLPNNWSRVWPQWGTFNHADMLARITDLSPQDYLFIFCHEIGPGTQVLGLAGQSSIVQQPPSGDGVTIRRDIFGGPSTCSGCPCEANQGKYLPHEVGHWLELHHVFFGGACGGNTPQDCHMQGDRICDIPYQNGWTYAFDCSQPSAYAGPACSLPPVHGNHMDYLADWKRTSFTPGQADRMHAHLQLNLPHLIDPAHVRRVGCAARILYVDADAPPGQGGTSWADAFDDLQLGLAGAQAGDEIWVAEGSYTPSSTGDTAASFEVLDGVQVYGGFAGVEGERSQRDIGAHPTVLNGGGLAAHVVRSAAGKFSVLDGFELIGGRSALLLTGSELALAQCYIHGNHGTGALIQVQGGRPTFQRCRIADNQSDFSVAGFALMGGAQVRVTDGGFFANLSTASDAGAIALHDSSTLLLVNSILADNQGAAAALVLHDRAQAEVLNATFSFNQSPAAIQVNDPAAHLRVVNSILHGHSRDIDNQLGSPSNEVSYTHLDAAPVNLISVPSSNLIGVPGLLPASGYALQAGSHCIDAGLTSAVSTYALWDYHDWADTSRLRDRVFDPQACQGLNVLNPGATPQVRVDLGAREFVGACFDPVIGVPGHVADAGVNWVPNPTTGSVVLRMAQPGSGSYRVLDGQGRLVLTGNVEAASEWTLDLAGCADGLYHVMWVHEGGWQAQKLVLRR